MESLDPKFHGHGSLGSILNDIIYLLQRGYEMCHVCMEICKCIFIGFIRVHNTHSVDKSYINIGIFVTTLNILLSYLYISGQNWREDGEQKD